MSTGLLQPTRGISAYTQTDQSTFVPVDGGSKFSSADDNAPTIRWDQLIDEIITIRFLEDDWDGEGSMAPDPGLVAGAMKLALALKVGKNPPADRVIASVNGTVYFEWHTPLGYQEIEVTSPVDAESRWVQLGSDETEVVGITIR